LRTRAARASRSGHEALAMEVLHSSQTGSWGMLRSRNWCSGAHVLCVLCVLCALCCILCAVFSALSTLRCEARVRLWTSVSQIAI
jgi:hypothetical protein